MNDDLFGVPLVADPNVALPSLKIEPSIKYGPLHRVQYVIEFVGPRSIAAAAVSRLLDQDWHQALGEPLLFAMRPSDLQWQPLLPSKDGSYDSLALAWDMLTEKGNLSSASALQLLQFAERFGPTIGRRAMPLPHPGDVNGRVSELLLAKEQLDIGFALNVAGDRGYEERALWIECARMGLEFSPEGTFDWKAAGILDPLLSVSPIGTTDAFSLGNVQRKLVHQGATIGFSVPLCPAPTQALDGCFRLADQLVSDLGGVVYDPDGKPLTEGTRVRLRTYLAQAIGAFTGLGITTGSNEAIKLFGR